MDALFQADTGSTEVFKYQGALRAYRDSTA